MHDLVRLMLAMTIMSETTQNVSAECPHPALCDRNGSLIQLYAAETEQGLLCCEQHGAGAQCVALPLAAGGVAAGHF